MCICFAEYFISLFFLVKVYYFHSRVHAPSSPSFMKVSRAYFKLSTFHDSSFLSLFSAMEIITLFGNFFRRVFNKYSESMGLPSPSKFSDKFPSVCKCASNWKYHQYKLVINPVQRYGLPQVFECFHIWILIIHVLLKWIDEQ